MREGNETLFGYPFEADSAVLSPSEVPCVSNGWEFEGVPLVPFVNVPPNDGFDTHTLPRRQPAAMEQMYQFFTQQQIVDTCDGPCIGPYTKGGLY